MNLFKAQCKLLGYTYKGLSEELQSHINSVYKWANGKMTIGPRFASKLKDLGFSDESILFPTREIE